MTETIKSEQKIIKGAENKYVFINNFEKEITEEEAKKFMRILKNNIDTLENNLKLDVDAEIEKEKKNLLMRFDIAKDALANYDAYEKRIIKEMKNSREQRKTDFKTYIDNFPQIMEENLKTIQTQIQNVIDRWNFQLEMEKQHLKLYTDAGFVLEEGLNDKPNENNETEKTA